MLNTKELSSKGLRVLDEGSITSKSLRGVLNVKYLSKTRYSKAYLALRYSI